MTAENLVSRFIQTTAPYHERLFRIAITLCHDRDLAADLTQETLVRAFNAFDRYRPEMPVLPWLARILRNYFLDTLKTGTARHEVAAHRLGEKGEDPYANFPCSGLNPADQAEQSQLSGLLAEGLKALDDAHRLAIILCDIEGFDYAEAAQTIGVPVGTVRSRLSRGRTLLRQWLNHKMSGKNS